MSREQDVLRAHVDSSSSKDLMLKPGYTQKDKCKAPITIRPRLNDHKRLERFNGYNSFDPIDARVGVEGLSN